jgi:hypothetical protein
LLSNEKYRMPKIVSLLAMTSVVASTPAGLAGWFIITIALGVLFFAAKPNYLWNIGMGLSLSIELWIFNAGQITKQMQAAGELDTYMALMYEKKVLPRFLRAVFATNE